MVENQKGFFWVTPVDDKNPGQAKLGNAHQEFRQREGDQHQRDTKII